MRQQAAPFARLGSVTRRAENDIAPNSVGVRVEAARRFRRRFIGVNPNAAEVVAETVLHHRASLSFQRPTSGMQGGPDCLRRCNSARRFQASIPTRSIAPPARGTLA